MRYFILSCSLLRLVVLAAAEPADSSPAIQTTDKSIDFLVGKDLIGRYFTDPAKAKPHFFPLNGPFGIPVTRGWPLTNDTPNEAHDHPHQKAVWYCHGDVIAEGMTL